MNYWKTLGIKKTTEKSEIKKAYREKLKKTRPDEDEAGFIKLREAYEYALSRNKTVIVCGSLYLYKDFRNFIDKGE